MSEWNVKNFERGMTDNYVNGARNAGQKFDNLHISKNKKPFSRPGSIVIDDQFSKIPSNTPLTDNQRIVNLASFNDRLFAVVNKQLFISDSTQKSLGEQKGPPDFFNSNTEYSAFTTGSVPVDLTKVSKAFWQNHMYMTNYQVDSNGFTTRSRPVKIYADEQNTYKLVTVGMPSHSKVRLLQSSIVLANVMKSTINIHIADLSEHNTSTGAIAAATATDIPTLMTLVSDIKDQYVTHIQDTFPGATASFHKGEATTSEKIGLLESEEDVETVVAAALMLNDIKNKYDNQHLEVNAAHTSDPSSPLIATADATDIPDNISTSGTGATYGLAIVYKFEYRVGQTTYVDRSAPAKFSVTDIDLSAGLSFDVEKLQQTRLGGEENWDSTDILIEIYMTEANGTVFKLRDVVRQDTDASDFVNVSINNTTNLGINLYTTGGVLPNGEPPKAKFIIQANDVLWYFNITEDERENEAKFRYSIPLNPDAVPATNFDELDGDITGAGSIGIFPIVFTEGKTWRLEGRVDALGSGFVKKRLVDETVGCISHDSIVDVKDGLYFAGKDGFYFTNGLKVVKISQHLKDSYDIAINKYTNAKIDIYGAYDPLRELIFWSMADRDPDPTVTEVDNLWVHDPYWGIPNKEGTFTTWSGSGDNFSPTALIVKDGDIFRGDRDGYIFRHRDTDTEDPIIDTSIAENLWESITVLYDYVSSAFNFGTEFQRKYVTKLLTVLKANTAANILPQSINDDSEDRRSLKAIKNSVAWAWGDPFFVWGDQTFVWRTDATQFAERRFPKNGIRCTLKQVAYINDRAVLTNSDAVGAVTANTVTKVITASVDWDNITGNSGLVGGLFIPGNDPGDSGVGFTILSVTDNTITVQDATNRLQSSYAQWLIVNFDRDETFHLEGYTINFELFGSSHTAYRPGSLGENDG